MNLKEQFAQKMLEEKLDFLPLEESLQLVESGVILETRFHYVCSVEELTEDGYNTPREYAEASEEIFGEWGIEIGDEERFDEFTYGICPAPTYIDLIK